MDILKKLFCMTNDEEIAIGLCKFSENFFTKDDIKQEQRKNSKKPTTLSEMLKKPV